MEIDKIEALIDSMLTAEDDAFKYSDTLASVGGEDVKQRIVPLLSSDRSDVRHLAARTLGRMKDKSDMLDLLLDAINNPKFQNENGGMVEALEGFDCSGHFVEIFRLYLSPHWKTSGLAKLILDYEEFDITPRVLRKAEKHWHHYVHNTKHDEAYEAKKQEVDAIFQDIRDLLDS